MSKGDGRTKWIANLGGKKSVIVMFLTDNGTVQPTVVNDPKANETTNHRRAAAKDGFS